MPEYVIRIIADGDKADKQVDEINKKLKELKKNSTVDVKFPSLGNVVEQVQNVGKTLEQTYKVARQAPVVGQRLQDLELVFEKIGSAAVKAKDGVTLLSQATPGNILSASFNKAISSADDLTRSVAKIGFTVFGVTQSVDLLRAAYGRLFSETIGREVRLQETLLRTRSTLISTARVISDGKEITDPYKALIALEKPIEQAISNIRQRSLDIAGTTSDAIIQTFDIIASQIGQVNGSLKDAENLAISFAAALGTIGLSDPMYAAQEIGSIMRGTIDQNSILARSLQISNEDIAKAKQSGKIIEFLTDKLKGFVAGQKIAAQSFNGLFSNLAEFREEFFRNIGKPLLEPVLAGLSSMYQLVSAISKQAYGTAEAFGRIGAVVAKGIFGAAAQAPSLQGLNQSTTVKAANGTEEAAAKFLVVVQKEVDKLAPTIRQISDSIVKVVAQALPAFAELAKGFASFKFEQFKFVLAAVADLASLLANTVVPVLSQILELYGQILQQPLAQYIGQLATNFAVLERVGVMPLVRFLFFARSVPESIKTIINWIQIAGDKIRELATTVFQSLIQAYAGVRNTILQGTQALVNVVLSGISKILAAVSALARGAQQQLVQLATYIQASVPALEALIGPILAAARAFSTLSTGARTAQRNIGQSVNQIITALERLQISTQQVTAQVQGIGARIATRFREIAASIGNMVKAQAVGFAMFSAQLLILQVGTAVVFDLYQRFTRQLEDQKAAERASAALERLSTTYKDVGDNSSLAARKLKEFEQGVVNARIDELVKQLADYQDQLGKLREFQASPGINSFDELLFTQTKILNDDFSNLLEVVKQIYSFINSVGDAFNRFFNDAIMAVVELTKRYGDFVSYVLQFTSQLPVVRLAVSLFQRLADTVNDLTKQLLGTAQANNAFTTLIKRADTFLDKLKRAAAFVAYLTGNPTALVLRTADTFDPSRAQKVTSAEEKSLRAKEAAAKAELERLTKLEEAEKSAADVRIAAQQRVSEAAKRAAEQIQEAERQHKDRMFQMEQQISRGRIEALRQEGEIRIRQVEIANNKVVANEQGVTKTVLERVAQYISTKLKGELDIKTKERSLVLEIADLEKQTVDYKYEVEKQVAALRKTVGEYESKVADYKAAKAKEEAAARAGGSPEGGAAGITEGIIGRVGSTGQSTGPHLDGRWGDLRPITVADLDKYLRIGGKKPSEWQQSSPYGPRNMYGRTFHYGVDVAGAGIENQPITLVGGARLIGSAFSKGGGQQANLMTPEGPLNLLHLIENSVPKTNPAAQWGSPAQWAANAGSSAAAKQAQALSFFMSKGLSKLSAASLVGGLMQESGVNLDATKINKKSGAEGISQWLDSRRTDMIQFGAQNNFSKQLEFMWKELQGSESASLQKLRNAKTLNEALTGSASYFRFYNWNKGINAGGEWGNRTNYTKDLLGMAAGPTSSLSAATAGSAITPPTLNLAAFDKMPAEMAAKQQQLIANLKRLADLQKQLADINTKDQLNNLLQGLFPDGAEPLKKVNDELELTKEGISVLSSTRLTTFEQKSSGALKALQQELRITENIYKDTAKRINDKALFPDLTPGERKTILDDLRKRVDTRKAEIIALFDANRELAKYKDIAESIAELNLSQQNRRLATETEVLRLQQAIGNVGLSPEVVNNPLLRRRQATADDIAANRRRLAAENPDLLSNPDFLAALQRDEEQARAAAEELGQLELALKRLTENTARADDWAKSFSDGFKASFMNSIQGGNMEDLTSAFTRTLGEKALSQFVDYAFKPIEDRMQSMFRDLFGVDSPSLKIEDAHTAAMQAHTAALLGATSGGPGAFNSFLSAPNGALTGGPKLDLNGIFGEDLMSAVVANFSGLNVQTSNLALNTDQLANAYNNIQPATNAALSSTQQFVGGLAMVSTSVMGIVGGLQRIRKGGASNILGGIGSALLGGVSLFSGLGGLGLKLFADGGKLFVDRPTMVGERGPELVLPGNGGTVIPNDQLTGYGATRSSLQGAAAVSRERDFERQRESLWNENRSTLRVQADYYKIQDLDVVTTDQFQRGINQAVRQSEANFMRKAQNDPAFRRRAAL